MAFSGKGLDGPLGLRKLSQASPGWSVEVEQRCHQSRSTTRTPSRQPRLTNISLPITPHRTPAPSIITSLARPPQSLATSLPTACLQPLHALSQHTPAPRPGFCRATQAREHAYIALQLYQHRGFCPDSPPAMRIQSLLSLALPLLSSVVVAQNNVGRTNQPADSLAAP